MFTGGKPWKSGTAEPWHLQNALASELFVGRGVNEHVDRAVGVRKPHDDELDGGRRLERADKVLRQSCHRVGTPAREVGDAGVGNDPECSTAADRVASPSSHSGWVTTS